MKLTTKTAAALTAVPLVAGQTPVWGQCGVRIQSPHDVLTLLTYVNTGH